MERCRAVAQPVGLSRVTVRAPQRNIDIALPEGVAVADLLPHILQHVGQSAADDGEAHGGWALRRTGGTLVEPQRTLSHQGIRDGEILHLVPRHLDWPEPAYDDVVDVIATGARRADRSWTPTATRLLGLVVTSLVLWGGAVELLATPPPRSFGAVVSLGFAVVLLAGGALLARGGGDATAGGVVGAAALPYAFVGGLLLAVGGASVTTIGAAPLLLGSAVAVLAGVIGYLGVAGLGRVFVAGVAAGLLGVTGALLRLWTLSPDGAAAVALTVAIGAMPAYPLVAAWLGRVPAPPLPQRAEDLTRDDPMPPRPAVVAAVVRAYELLGGLLIGVAVVVPVCVVVLLRTGGAAQTVLALTGTVATLLRGRLFPAARHRIPLLVGGLVAAVALAAAVSVQVGPAARLGGVAGGEVLVHLGVVTVAAAIALASGLMFARRPPSPRLGRLADTADVVMVVLLVPLTCLVAGLYDAIRGLLASLS
jgi:type VII secretion integral membrane protein EccD